jgi:hypothetical protein
LTKERTKGPKTLQAPRKTRKKKPTTRNDAADYEFPSHLQREYNLQLVQMVKALDRRLLVAHRLALSDDHFRRLADVAVVDVLRTFKHTDIARGFVAKVYAWLPIAWRSSRPFNSVLEQKVAVLRQAAIIRSLVEKQVAEFTKARLLEHPKPGFEKARIQSLNKAAFYARNEAGTVYHDVSVKQAAHDGFIGYVWVRTTSVSPRDIHIKRVGQFFLFGEVKDEPGVLWNCKCSMRPMAHRPT